MRRVFWVLLALKSTLYSQNIEHVKNTDSIVHQNLEEVIISATRTQRQLSSIPLPVILIPKNQIQKSGTIRLNEILNEQTGIITVADESGFEGIQMQGISSDYIMILIDGVPLVGRSAGNLDLSRLTVGNIKQIEVIKGPSSSLFGSEAMGGVINIITDTPKSETLNGSASFRIASFNTQDSNLTIAQRKNKFSYNFFANRLFSDGYDLREETPGQTVDPFENYTFQGKIWYEINNTLSLFASGRYYFQDQDLSLFFNNNTFEGTSDLDEWNVQVRLEHDLASSLKLQYELYYTNYKASELLANPLDNEVFSQSDFDQHLFRPEIRANYNFSPKKALTLGTGWNNERLNRTFFDEEIKFNSQYVFTQYDFYPLSKVNIILGARFDNHSEYQSQFSPKISIKYDITKNLSFKTSTGYGFKAPDFRQLYFDFTNSAVGYTVLGYNVAVDKLNELIDLDQIIDVVVDINALNTPLKPESSIGFNFGVTYTNDNFLLEANYFRNEIENLIDTRVIARKTNGQNVFSYTNFNNIFTTGLEINTQYKLTKNIKLLAGYQLLYAKDKDVLDRLENGEFFARDSESLETFRLEKSDYFGLLNRSRHTANLKIFYEIPQWDSSINVRINYRSKYGLINNTEGGNDILDIYDPFVNGYALTNLAINKTFKKNYKLQLGVNNMFDYTDIQNISNLAGRQIYGKMEIQF
ncbi:TonB-dependent siderophore receptor [Aquimarina sp. AU474]|uniref:TonB-dependent receptor plug domain-containing protein n=1 Tax=Aquimarina sp. AU474 TaxID=2108529 RepID=UPI000D693FCC|nr:TonB-dependent receptor [Aquimarina sp. AU474]